MTLSDGLVLPKDAYICVVNSSSIGRESDQFDGFRYAQKRPGQLQSPGSTTLKARPTWYTSTDQSHITFGQGRYACPGRFVAAVEIKLVFAAMLMRYDFRFGGDLNGKVDLGPKGRPVNLHLLELGFTDPSMRVLVRKREDIV